MKHREIKVGKHIEVRERDIGNKVKQPIIFLIEAPKEEK
jgi:hypothetical protein